MREQRRKRWMDVWGGGRGKIEVGPQEDRWWDGETRGEWERGGRERREGGEKEGGKMEIGVEIRSGWERGDRRDGRRNRRVKWMAGCRTIDNLFLIYLLVCVVLFGCYIEKYGSISLSNWKRDS